MVEAGSSGENWAGTGDMGKTTGVTGWIGCSWVGWDGIGDSLCHWAWNWDGFLAGSGLAKDREAASGTQRGQRLENRLPDGLLTVP